MSEQHEDDGGEDVIAVRPEREIYRFDDRLRAVEQERDRLRDQVLTFERLHNEEWSRADGLAEENAQLRAALASAIECSYDGRLPTVRMVAKWSTLVYRLPEPIDGPGGLADRQRPLEGEIVKAVDEEFNSLLSRGSIDGAEPKDK